MSFLKNIFVIGKDSYSKFTNDIEAKAKAIEVTNQEKIAKGEALQRKIKHAELEKIMKVEASQKKIEQAELEKKMKVEASQKKIEQAELVKKANQKIIKKLIASGFLERVKTTIESKEDALKSLTDDEFVDVVSKSTAEKGSEEFAIDFYVNHAKAYYRYEVIDYLSTLQ